LKRNTLAAFEKNLKVYVNGCSRLTGDNDNDQVLYITFVRSKDDTSGAFLTFLKEKTYMWDLSRDQTKLSISIDVLFWHVTSKCVYHVNYYNYLLVLFITNVYNNQLLSTLRVCKNL